MEFVEKQSIKLSGHQTFPFRYGWLEKGISFLQAGNSFQQEDAFVELGVGKNMAESIKYWLEMAGLIDLSDGSLTELSNKLLGKNGWDPFLEDDASLWIIHWEIATNPRFFSSGTALFSLVHKPEFSKIEVLDAIKRFLLKEEKKLPSESVLKRDVDCYLRVYASLSQNKKGEESFSCPLQDLGLIHPMFGTDMFRFSIGPKPTLPPEIICFSIWDYLFNNRRRTTMRLQEALYQTYSPGQVFKLDENTIVDAITTIQTHPVFGSRFAFTETSGIAMIQCTMENGFELLNQYYCQGGLS